MGDIGLIDVMTSHKTAPANGISQHPTDPSATFRLRLIFFIILGTGIALRVLRVIHTPVISPDSVGYIHNALAIRTEGLRSLFLNGFGGNFSVYPILIYLVDLLVENPILSGQLVSLFFGCLLIVPIYLLTKEMMGARAGLIAAFLAAVHPHLIRYSAEVLKDSMLFFFAIASVILALWGQKRKNYLMIFLAGLAAWTTCLVRVYGIAVVAGISVAIIASGLLDRRRWHVIARELLLFTVPVPAAGYLLFIVLMGAGNEYILQSLVNLFISVAERFRAVGSYRDILITHNPGVDPEYLDVITSHPRLSALREFVDVLVTAFTGFLFGLFLPGVYLNRTSLLKRGPGLFVLSCAATLILVNVLMLMAVFFLSKRHVMILVILLLPWSAFALDRLILWCWEQVRKKYRIERQTFYRIVTVAFFIWVIMELVLSSYLDPGIDKYYYRKAAGEYIKGLGSPNPSLLIPRSDSILTFYSGGTEIVLDDATTLGQTIAEKRPDFIAWDTAARPLPEGIAALLDMGVIEQINTIERTVDGESIVIYRIRKD
jgi:hypothetical protein